MTLGLVVAALLAFIAWQFAEPFLRSARRRRLRARPFPEAWRATLEALPLYRRLPEPLRDRLRGHVQVFLAEKQFVGCRQQEVTDEVRVAIAAQACLLVLDRGIDAFARLSQVLVYPGPFVVERVRPEPSGVLQEHRSALSGESWTHGQVVLSWEDVVLGALGQRDGNVVLHEFAHQLDQQKGFANGAPPGRRSARWKEVMAREFEALRVATAWGVPTLLDPYGATDPAEFFAVATEAFFCQGGRLAAEHPELYAELARFYGVDPAAW